MNFAEARECVEHGYRQVVVVVKPDVFQALLRGLAPQTNWQNTKFRPILPGHLLYNGMVVVSEGPPDPPPTCERCGRQK